MQAFSIKLNSNYKQTFESLQEFLLNHDIKDVQILDNITDIDVRFILAGVDEKIAPGIIEAKEREHKKQVNALLVKNNTLEVENLALEKRLKELSEFDESDLKKKLKSVTNNNKTVVANNKRYIKEIKELKKKIEKMKKAARRQSKQPGKNVQGNYSIKIDDLLHERVTIIGNHPSCGKSGIVKSLDNTLTGVGFKDGYNIEFDGGEMCFVAKENVTKG